MTIDSLSLCTTPIYLFNNNNLVSQGTGFFYYHTAEKINVLFLITNHHVLTGYPPNEAKDPIGDNIIFTLHKSDSETGLIKKIKLPLFTKTNKPIWINNKEYPNADLAVIPIISSAYSDCKINIISAKSAETEFLIRPTTRITLIGYPYGIFDKENALPIWKTGNIASEPEVNFNGEPLFLVDISAFPGMSGSPVFAVSYGTYERKKGTTSVGYARKFLGIYASMIQLKQNKFLEEIVENANYGIEHTESLQLGHVWKAELILNTVQSIDFNKYQTDILNNL